MIVSVLSDLVWLPLLGGGRKSLYIIIIINIIRSIITNIMSIIIMWVLPLYYYVSFLAKVAFCELIWWVNKVSLQRKPCKH